MLSPLDTVRSVLRDPLYRAERLQTWTTSTSALAGLALLVVLVIPILGLVLPALWAAESILRERGGGTMESLLLTPVDRQRVIWAKLLARLRPLAILGPCCPAVGAAFGTIICVALEVPAALGACVGTVLGLVAGLELLAFGFTAGTAGILAAMESRGRITVMLRALLYETAVLFCNGALLVLALAPAPVLAYFVSHHWQFRLHPASRMKRQGFP